MLRGMPWAAALALMTVVGCGAERGGPGGEDGSVGPDAGPGTDAGPASDAGSEGRDGGDAGPSCLDEDEDGYGEGCDLGADCDDANAAINPGATEVCNGADDDCDEALDEELVAPSCALGEGVCAGATATCAGDLGWAECGAEEYGTTWEADEAACDGADNDCDGTTDEGCTCTPGDTQACGSDVGACMAGTQTCTDAAAWGSCEGTVGPMGESCNGADDDCDGAVDEPGDLTAPACPLQVGVCVGSERACDGASGWGTCAGTSSYGADYEATETSCDLLDNDCDGVTDEGCTCIDGDTQPCGTDIGACSTGVQTCTAGAWGACAGEVAPTGETCNGVDDDCDGTVDEELTGPTCALTAGVCSGARQQCTGGSFDACAGTSSYGPSYQADETSCDGLDNDCDGVTDEGCACVVGATQDCGSSVGACTRGTQTCTASGWGACSGGTEPVAETCNGQDDDCNGTTDDGLTAPACALTEGVCAGVTQQCGGASGWQSCGAADYGPAYVATEDGAADEALCDGLDNDCDGDVDEGCASGPLVTAAHDLFWPAIYDRHVAYVGTPDGNQDVFVSDLRTGATTRLTATTEDEHRPDVYGDIVVYQRGADAAARVVAYDLATSTETVLTSARSERPRLYGPIVVWQDARHGTDWDVYVHDLRDGSETALITGTANQAAPDIRGGTLVYSNDTSGNWRVHVMDLATGVETVQNPTATRPQSGAVADWGVFGWTDGRATTDPLTTESNWDVYGALLSAVTTDVAVSTQPGAQILGGVDGALYAWSDRGAGNWDIVIGAHGGTEVAITSSAATQADPAISGDLVVWEDNRLGTYDIYASQLLGIGTAAAGEVDFNEILFDPPPSADVNGDGVSDPEDDELLELVNTRAIALDIGGYTISDGIGVRHTFAAETVIPAGGAILVFGGGTPTGTFGGVHVVTASSGTLGLNNGGDTVTLADGTGTVIATHTYSGTTSDQSIVRDPEYTGSFVAHSAATDAGGRPYSPGNRAYGYGF